MTSVTAAAIWAVRAEVGEGFCELREYLRRQACFLDYLAAW